MNPRLQKHSNMINSQLYEKILEEDMCDPLEEHSPDEYPHHSSQQSDNRIEMVIEYGNNKTASLWVGPNDDPTTLAKRFCYKHNIDPHVIATLASNIRTLQMNSFSVEKSQFKIEKNGSHFDDKQNNNRSNLPRSRSKSHQLMNDSSMLKGSRNKTNQSNVVADSNSSRYNVFQRLYKDSKKKAVKGNNQSKRSEHSRTSLNVTGINKSLNESSIQSCLQIYQKNTKLKQEILKHNEQLFQMKSQKQLERCSFKPQINPLSKLIAVKLRELDESSIINRSNNERQMTKIKDYLLKREEEQMKQCTFKPKIIAKMSKDSSAYSSSQRYKQLHEDHMVREAKKKMIGQQINRQLQQKQQPVINRISKIVVQKSFFQRLEEDTLKRLSKQESVQKIVNQSRIQRRPSTGRPPANRPKGDKTIGQYLYELSRKSRALSTKEQPQILTDPRSNQLHLKSKQLAIQYIFQLLDSDRDGLICSTKISISALPEEVLKLLAPLLSEMEEVGVQLNLQEFAMALEKLFSTFSVAQKNTILKVYKSKEVDSRVSEIPNFTPNLNDYSLKIARELSNDDVDIYQNSLVRIKEKENKLNRLRAQKMLDQYSECTFHPKIHH